MATNFNQYLGLLNDIVNQKKNWSNANQQEQTKKTQYTKNKAAKLASDDYQKLAEQGTTGQNIANKIRGMGVDEAQRYIDSLSVAGKSQVRPALYNLGKKYGLTQEDIDKNLTYDENTGELGYGGYSLGTAEGMKDGYSYMDGDTLNQNFAKIMKDQGVMQNPQADAVYRGDTSSAYADTLFNSVINDKQELQKKYDEALKLINGDNALNSDWGKAIMAEYDKLGNNTAGASIASSAGSNAGNVDAYAAEQAARNRVDYKTLGINAVRQDLATRLGAATDLLKNLGLQFTDDYSSANSTIDRSLANNQQIFDQRQSAMNNDISRQNAKDENARANSETLGAVTTDLSTLDNPYFNGDGSLAAGYENIDFSAKANELEAELKNTTDPQRKSLLQGQIYQLRQAALAKTQDPRFSQYAGSVTTPGQRLTESARQANQQNDQVYASLGAQAEQNAAENALENRKLDITEAGQNAEIEAQRQQALNNTKQNTISDKNINNTMGDSGPVVLESTEQENKRGSGMVNNGKNQYSSLSKDKVKSIAKKINTRSNNAGLGDSVKNTSEYKFTRTDKASDSAIIGVIMQEPGLTQQQINDLLNLFEVPDSAIKSSAEWNRDLSFQPISK